VLVNKAAVGMNVSCWGNPVTYGGAFQCSAGLTFSGSGPTGSITYAPNGGLPAGSVALNGGWAQFAIPNAPVGNYTVTIGYAGDGNYLGAASQTVGFTVNAAPVTLALTPSAYSAAVGGSVNLVAKVRSLAKGAPTPTGMVKFSDKDGLFATQPLVNGVANTNRMFSTAGADTITAEYDAQGNYGGSSDNQTVNVH